jgi:hypothetical protein
LISKLHFYAEDGTDVTPLEAHQLSGSLSIRESKDVAFHAITTAWLRKWMYAEPINEQLVKENFPRDDRFNTFDEWEAYARFNAIVSLISLATVIQNLTPLVALPYSRLSIL